MRIETKRFFPEERGRVVTTFLKEFFTKYVEYDYTAGLEDELDIISNGEMNWKVFLEKFWKSFYKNIKEVEEKPFVEVLEFLNQKIGGQIFGVDKEGNAKNECPTCKTGKLGLRLGKFGAFIGCSNYPECKHTMHIFEKEEGVDGEETKQQFDPRNLGKDPKTGFDVIVKIGPYGPYLELEGSEIVIEPAATEIVVAEKTVKTSKKKKTPVKEKKPKKPKIKKPKRVSIPKSIDPNQIDLKTAIGFLQLPREIGIHPETGKKIIASVGPYGPYVSHDGKYASLKEDDVLEVGLNRAIDLLVEAANRPKRGRGGVRKKKPTA